MADYLPEWFKIFQGVGSVAGAANAAGGITPNQNPIQSAQPGAQMVEKTMQTPGGGLADMPSDSALVAEAARKSTGTGSGFMDFLKDREKVMQAAIVLDMIGTGLDPKNPFAGVATKIGQSYLSSKAAEKSTKARNDNIAAYIAASKQAQTPQGQAGDTTWTTTTDKEGNISYTIKGDGDPADRSQAQVPSLVSSEGQEEVDEYGIPERTYEGGVEAIWNFLNAEDDQE